MSLSFVLHAKNSSGHQMLDIYRDRDGTFSFRLWGDYEGKSIQVDFCPIDGRDMDDFIAFLSINRDGSAKGGEGWPLNT